MAPRCSRGRNYLIEGAVGLPVFAGTPLKGIGLAYMAGPTGGYLAGYLLAAVLVGILLAGRSKPPVLSTALAMAAGELVILGVGCAWLAVQLGWEDALALGVAPLCGRGCCEARACSHHDNICQTSDRSRRWSVTVH